MSITSKYTILPFCLYAFQGYHKQSNIFIVKKGKVLNMKKSNTLLSLVLVVILVMAFATPSFAATNPTAKIEILVDNTNMQINQLINTAVIKAANTSRLYESQLAVMSLRQVNTSKSSVLLSQSTDTLYSDYMNSINTLGTNLIDDALAKTTTLIDRTSDSGVGIICELVPVTLGGTVFMVDPLRICSW